MKNRVEKILTSTVNPPKYPNRTDFKSFAPKEEKNLHPVLFSFNPGKEHFISNVNGKGNKYFNLLVLY